MIHSNQSDCEYQFFCLSFNNPTRKENMKRRFESIGIDCKFNEGVTNDDDRMKGRNNSSTRVWSCMYGHLDMISDFYYNTDKEFGIFCEDDLYIHKELANKLPEIMLNFNYLELDVLLLGYLLHYKLEKNVLYHNFPEKKSLQNNKTHESNKTDVYYDYPNDVWGAQMYMLSRNSAKKILDKYSFPSGYADRTLNDNTLTPFSADWTITKDGNRALIFPMLAVEDNQSNYEHIGQKHFHQACFQTHFVSEQFII